MDTVKEVMIHLDLPPPPISFQDVRINTHQRDECIIPVITASIRRLQFLPAGLAWSRRVHGSTSAYPARGRRCTGCIPSYHAYRCMLEIH